MVIGYICLDRVVYKIVFGFRVYIGEVRFFWVFLSVRELVEGGRVLSSLKVVIIYVRVRVILVLNWG